MDEALEASLLWPMQEYVRRLQATIEDYIATRPIYDLCTAAGWLQVKSHIIWWWDLHDGW